MIIEFCLYCHKEFSREKGSKKVYCSKNCCTYASQKRNLTPEKRRINFENFKKRRPDYFRLWRKKNRKKINKQALENQERYREKALSLIGSKCVICDSSERICFHEIHNKNHPRNDCYVIKHYQDFIPLCMSHHSTLHRLIELKKLGFLEKTLKIIMEKIREDL
jgi:hypothetical protein